MIQGDSAVLILVPSLGKPTMPPHEVGPAPVRRPPRCPRAPPPPPCVIKDALHGNRVHGWLGNSRGLISRRRIGRQLRGLPARGTREISVDPVREDNVRDHPIGPLRREQGVQLGDSAFDTQRRQLTATNAASQLHMCGYSLGAALVMVPRSLPLSRYAARAASCVGVNIGWDGIRPLCGVLSGKSR